MAYFPLNDNAKISGISNSLNNVCDSISDAYDSTQTYAVGDYCVYDGQLYRCITAISTAETFDVTKWVATNVMSELSSKLSGYLELEGGN